MNIYNELGILSIGTLIGVLVKHLLDIYKGKADRLYEIKKEAYVKATGSLAGLSNSIVQEVLISNGSYSKGYACITELKRNIAAALLIGGTEIKQKLEQISFSALLGVKNAVDYAIAPMKTPEKENSLKELQEWEDQIKLKIDEVLDLMRKDIGI